MSSFRTTSFAFSALLLGLSCTTSAVADFVDCPGLIVPMETKSTLGRVVLGEIVPEEGHQFSEYKLRLLEAALDQRLADLAAKMSGRIEMISCRPHFPSRTDYTTPIVLDRYRYGVLIELWGASAENNAIISYVLLPALLPDFSTPEIARFIEVSYDFETIDLVFSQATDLQAYTTFSLGLRYLHEAVDPVTPNADAAIGFARAYAVLCEAHSLMIEEAARPAARLGLSPQDWLDLADFTLERSDDARTAAGQLGIATALTAPPKDMTIGGCALPVLLGKRP